MVGREKGWGGLCWLLAGGGAVAFVVVLDGFGTQAGSCEWLAEA